MSYVQNNGIKIHYEVHGEGEPLVLLHGFTSSIQQWKLCGYVDELMKSHRLVLIDLRGNGRSDKPHDPECYDLESRLADIEAVLSELRIESAHFFGYSMGGWLAFGMAVRYPELVRTLIVGGAHPYADALETFRGVDGSDPDAFIAALEGFIGEKISDDARSVVLQNDLSALAAAARGRHGFEPHLKALKKPILLFSGDRDNRYRLVQRAATELGAEQLVMLPGAGHVTSLFARAALLPHIRAFLHRHSGLGLTLPKYPLETNVDVYGFGRCTAALLVVAMAAAPRMACRSKSVLRHLARRIQIGIFRRPCFLAERILALIGHQRFS